MTEPENALLKQYTALLGTEGVSIEFQDDAIARIAEVADEVNRETENIGARRLHTVMTVLLEEVLFDIPDKEVGSIVVTSETVNERLDPITTNSDLSRYVL